MRRALAASAVLCVSLYAQVAGRVTGQVSDATGANVPGAVVSLMLPGGTTPVLTTVTTTEGLFNLTSVRPEFYDVTIESQGFKKVTFRSIKVDAARETVVPHVKLEVAAVAEVVEVAAGAQMIQTSNAEVSATISMDAVRKLPSLNRSPLGLIVGQAGVSDGRGDTVINGQRTSFSNVTMDGINIQDNMIRANGLDFLPNMLLIDQVAEVTISTSNTNTTIGGGASQVNFITPSGTNRFHGSGFWHNRNNAVSANTWFNNRDGIGRPFLNQNQTGGSIGGPISKDKLFFYANYEAFRNHTQATNNRTILTADARQGIFTYDDTAGVVRKVNILQAAGVSTDPAIQQMLSQLPGPDKINNFRVGDSRETLLRNTAGFSFLARNNRIRDNATVKIDYNLSPQNVFTGTYAWNRDIVDRNDTGVANDYSTIPRVTNDDGKSLVSAAWRWNPRPSFTNELRGGFNLAPASFITSETFPQFIIAPPPGTFISNPLNTFRAQGRATNTYSLMNNSNYVRGAHNFQFGYQNQFIRTAPYNDAGITPTYNLGIGTGNQGLTAAQLPSVRATDVTIANNLLATLAGYINDYTQTFNVTGRTSGFVDGATNLRNYLLNNHAFYFQDNWKVRPRFTLTLGVRYDYFGVVDERDSLTLQPQLINNNSISTLLGNPTLDFAGSAAGRPYYGKDYNNFAPNLGLAWDLFGNGKTALRAGYSFSYVNDEHIVAIRNSVQTTEGLVTTATRSGVAGRISSGRPAVPTPKFQVPRTLEDNYRVNSQAALAMPEPGLRTPYVQQWSFGIQQEIKGTIIEARYVGNHGTKLFRAFDFNQVAFPAGYLDDFRRALNNGNLARTATGVFNPNFNANIAGSQALTFFSRLPSGGLLDNATIRSLIETGQAGDLASTYQINGLNGPVSFFPNPFGLGMNLFTNYSNSTYNAFQFEARRRPTRGLILDGNYTFSKVLSDSFGTAQARFEPFLDNNNGKIERARAPFDITHAIKANYYYELPFGDNHRLQSRPLRRLLSGWGTSGLLIWQSGGPFSIHSARGTLNRASSTRSDSNTATSNLNKSQLDELLKFQMTGNGPYIVAASARGADGRGVGPDGRPAFTGQAFFHPGPGEIGALQRRMFSGPWTFSLDAALLKETRIKEGHSIEVRMEAFNVFNNPTFAVLDLNSGAANTGMNISSTTFGRITNTFYGRRIVQFSAQYRF